MNKLELKEILLKTNPQYFGLGFIQCKINQHERVHIYHPDLMPIVNIEEEIHNHRYDFESTILMGKLTIKNINLSKMQTIQLISYKMKVVMKI